MGIINKEIYHTLENRAIPVEGPILCNKDNAWLGTAYYFWYDVNDAHIWGKISYKNKSYEIYSAEIKSDKILDTVFNEDDYSFWVSILEKVAIDVRKRTGKKPNVKNINSFIMKVLNSIDDNLIEAIMFQDLPFSRFSLIKGYNYKKRIQIAVYKKEIIINFKLLNIFEYNYYDKLQKNI